MGQCEDGLKLYMCGNVCVSVCSIHSHGTEFTGMNEGGSEIEPEPQITPRVDSVTSTRRNSDARLVLRTVKFTQLTTILDLYCRIWPETLELKSKTMRHIV